MIQFANSNTNEFVRQTWKTCFGDTDDYINLLFDRKYKEENTLIYFEENIPTASLQMFPYTLNFYGENVPFYYLAGLCTLPEHRRKGHMGELIVQSFEVMKEREIPLAILVPAEDSLIDFYRKYEYEQISDRGEQPLMSLKELLKETSSMDEAFLIFDEIFNKKDFNISKNFDEFETIIEDLRLDDFPHKYNLASMASIVNIKYMLDIYAKHNEHIEFIAKILDNCIYHIHDGLADINNTLEFDFEIDRRFLTRLLFGYKTNEVDDPFRNFFPPQEVSINLMLE